MCGLGWTLQSSYPVLVDRFYVERKGLNWYKGIFLRGLPALKETF